MSRVALSVSEQYVCCSLGLVECLVRKKDLKCVFDQSSYCQLLFGEMLTTDLECLDN